jgi:thioredoxin reductase (NADPH)
MIISKNENTLPELDRDPPLDCLIVGGGPAGLTAAIYLARFRRNARVIDSAKSRLCLIPTSHNYPGFPQGVHGQELHDRLTAQALHYGAQISHGTITHIAATGEGTFSAIFGEATLYAKTILLATGSTDIAPNISGFEEALRSAALRYCPICDGFEAIGRKVAVLGSGTHGVKESLFIRHYATDLTLISPTTRSGTTPLQMDELASHGEKLIDGDVTAIECKNDRISVHLANGIVDSFDVLYSALGLTANSSLATGLGLDLDDDSQVKIDEHMQSSMTGVYAVGDVAHGLNQISVATGQAAIAATAIHNLLCTTNSCEKQ